MLYTKADQNLVSPDFGARPLSGLRGADSHLPVKGAKAQGLPVTVLKSLASRMLGIQEFRDVHERAAERGVSLPLGKRRCLRLQKIKTAQTLFIHVPKNAGTSISRLLYGESMRHESVRYYRHVARELFSDQIVRFAIWRDPVDRFLSAYDFARKGGTAEVKISPAFQKKHMALKNIDAALDMLENAGSYYKLDHVFRPQSWYICDKYGAIDVDFLIDISRMDKISASIPALVHQTIPVINKTDRRTFRVTDQQRARILKFYASDEALRQHLA
ncbi:sulfotransferase family 2 domain-containing protein [Acetobacter sp. TBRC 12305]|uniref:Sulfotransferase family 2 domain-containing protein n=2 Tax=Acetobacter garciniae TaxID=2817435 RepID=A0A939HNT1_9PROT|nr:sulfotransferase family 2 domain-containing protein [Acetobacter garciniae]MBX0345646.1 sulfotransferase family 2 domain-containing protein [Acetobacter garciniae]